MNWRRYRLVSTRIGRGGRRFAGIALAAAIGWGPLACNDARRFPPPPPDGAELPILRQYVVADSRVHRQMWFVVRDAAAWSRMPLIEEHIDFDDEMALVIMMGRRTREGAGIRIARVWREGPLLRVETAVETPPPSGAALVAAAPFCVAIVPKCGLPVAGFEPEPPRYGESAGSQRRRARTQSGAALR
ncbi:MAG: hypothetical protein V3T70_11625 [Phycisphaerae bacterium]